MINIRNLHIILFLIMLFSSNYSYSFNSNKKWLDGKIILTNGQVLSGNLNLDLKNQVVKIEVNELIKTYTPFSIKYLRFYDPNVREERVFTSQNRIEGIGLVNSIFLELLMEGSISVLLDDKYLNFNKTLSKGKNYDLVYYIINVNSKNYLIKNFNIEVLPLFNTYKKEILEFASEHKLNLSSAKDQIYLINYFNYLIQKK